MPVTEGPELPSDLASVHERIGENDIPTLKTLLEFSEHRDVCLNTLYRKKFALTLAIELGNTSAAELLLHYGADVNLQDIHGETALHAAVEMKSVACVEFLIEKGAKSCIFDTQRLTATHRAIIQYRLYVSQETLEILFMVLQHGCSVNYCMQPQENMSVIQMSRQWQQSKLSPFYSRISRNGIVVQILTNGQETLLALSPLMPGQFKLLAMEMITIEESDTAEETTSPFHIKLCGITQYKVGVTSCLKERIATILDEEKIEINGDEYHIKSTRLSILAVEAIFEKLMSIFVEDSLGSVGQMHIRLVKDTPASNQMFGEEFEFVFHLLKSAAFNQLTTVPYMQLKNIAHIYTVEDIQFVEKDSFLNNTKQAAPPEEALIPIPVVVKQIIKAIMESFFMFGRCSDLQQVPEIFLDDRNEYIQQNDES